MILKLNKKLVLSGGISLAVVIFIIAFVIARKRKRRRAEHYRMADPVIKPIRNKQKKHPNKIVQNKTIEDPQEEMFLVPDILQEEKQSNETEAEKRQKENEKSWEQFKELKKKEKAEQAEEAQ